MVLIDNIFFIPRLLLFWIDFKKQNQQIIEGYFKGNTSTANIRCGINTAVMEF